MLELEGITKRLGGNLVLNGVSFSVRPGTITALIGPNGAGKTTTLNVINGLLKPDRGKVLLQTRDVTGLPPHFISRLGIARMLQDPRVFQEMQVLDNVMIAFPRQVGENPLVSLIGGARYRAEEQRRRDQAMELLRLVGLEGWAHELAGRLSYGQQRRLSLARCLATESPLLLLDEPTVGVHPEVVERMMELLSELVHNRGKTILLVEHNMDVVMALSDEVIVLLGEVIATGRPEAIRRDQRVLEVYLGATMSQQVAETAHDGYETELAAKEGVARD
jgi:ABC-type branched-subunit amino acid transport system ATPase component